MGVELNGSRRLPTTGTMPQPLKNARAVRLFMITTKSGHDHDKGRS